MFHNPVRDRRKVLSMTLVHHDSRGYKEATSAAAVVFKAKLDGWIHEGNIKAKGFFETLDANKPVDYTADVRGLRFDVDSEDQILVTFADKEKFTLHTHALNQMVAKTGILTQGVSTKMLDARGKAQARDGGIVVEERWGKELLLHNLHTIFSKSNKKALLRTVGREVRGFVSDRFNRLDCAPIFNAFAEEAHELGCVPIEPSEKYHPIFSQDIRNGFALFLPMVFEPVENEVMIVGLSILNSDFGGSPLTVGFIIVRLWCTNMAYRQDCLRKIHLGATLPDDIEMSIETFEANTKAMACNVRDVVKGMLGPARVNNELDMILKASQETVDPKLIFGNLRRGGLLNKGETARVIEVYNQPDIVMLPPGQNRWRASSAISLFANELEAEGKKERAIEVRQVAGKLIDDIDPEAASRKRGKNGDDNGNGEEPEDVDNE